jgi:ParB-like chromosome segregation protein Spo0J
VSVDDIRPSPENEDLYRPADPADPEIVELACSVKAHGVQDPLILTADHFIVSGHRRLVAAKLAGLAAVPCKMLDLRRVMLETFGGWNGVETGE